MRLAGIGDVPTLVDLMAEFYAESGYALDRAAAAQAFRDLLSDARLGRVWLVEFEGEVAGHVVLTLRYAMEYGGLMGCLDDLYVKPVYRNRGLSTAALRAVLEHCRTTGIRAVSVEVGFDNAAAQRVYRRVGFEELGDRQLSRSRLRSLPMLLDSRGVGLTVMEDIRARYSKLYTAAIADMLDKFGYRKQVLPREITPFTAENRVAGPAFTGQGYPCADPTDDDTQLRLEMLASIPAGTVSLWATGGSIDCAQWGEIMSMAARQRGCTGTVIDGGVRDLRLIDAMGYPVFARFHCAASSVGRWSIREWNVPIRIGDTLVHPGDYVFGDVDGVVVVPKDLTVEVLVAAEGVFERERGMREDLRSGVPIKEAYARHGAF